MNIKLETLSSIHVGSGNELIEGQDFTVIHKDTDIIDVIDVNKLGQYIDKKYINNWVSMVNGGKAIGEILKMLAPGLDLAKCTKYSLDNFAGTVKPKEPMKEVIRDGRGLPYLPGSSIKGAIRTAVLGELAKKHASMINERNYKRFEKKVLGDNPYTDLFKFIQVGDAFFEGNESVIATRLGCLNLRKAKADLHDGKIDQLIEAIRIQEKASFSLKIDSERYQKVARQFPDLGELHECMSSIPSLFMTVNRHTQQLVEDEIKRWESVEKLGAGAYIENMKDVLCEVNKCREGKDCVLRIGAGSGWRFTTGAWTESLDFFDTDVVPESRRFPERYEDYFFPKTRRMEVDGDDVLGFVKLSTT
jgi:CRISPR type III-A-associated RAMP protein Csm5